MSEATVLTYARLYQLLEDLGFEDESVPGSHRVFRHRRSDTVVVQAIHKPADPVSLVDLKSTRRILDEKGLLAKSEFDRLTDLAHTPPPPASASGPSGLVPISVDQCSQHSGIPGTLMAVDSR